MPEETPATQASKYERLTVSGRSFNAKILSETALFLSFRKVNREGDETEEKVVDGVIVINQHLMDKNLITKRTPLKMNLTYGELEKA